MRSGVRFIGACLLLSAGVAAAQVVLTVRVLPQPLGTNSEPFRVGFQAGFLGGTDSPLAAERLLEESLVAESQVTAQAAAEFNTGLRSYRVSNEGEKAGGVLLSTAPLRKGVPYTVRVRCRVKAKATLHFSFAPVEEGSHERIEKKCSVKGVDFVEKTFAVTPRTDGTYQCAFRLAPGCQMEFAGFSMLPDDSPTEWDSQAVEALRTVNPGVLRWPEERAAGSYNWYDGVGPRAMRAERGHAFGTVECVGFCRLIGVQPMLRVTMFQQGCSTGSVDTLEAGVQLAADWVAYCNATGNQPLAALRARHGYAEPLGVGRWELALPAGGKPEATGFGAACRAYATAMRAADASIQLGVRLEPGEGLSVSNVLQQAGDLLDFVSCGAAEASEAVAAYNRTRDKRVAWADTRLEGVRDRYVAEELKRLAVAGNTQELAYYSDWYGALSVINDALRGLRVGCGPVCAPYTPGQVLCRASYSKHMLTEKGRLLSLVNRFPAKIPLVIQGATSAVQSPFQVVAAWTEDESALVMYVYNSGPESRTVRLDLTALERRFTFWASEQIAADLAAKKQVLTVPVTRKLKAGAALTQVVHCESEPSSFTRIIVKE